MRTKVKFFTGSGLALFMAGIFVLSFAGCATMRSTSDSDTSMKDQNSMYFPTGRKDSSVIYVKKDVPSVVRIGEVFTYTIMLQNISDIELENVNISELIPAGFTVSDISPVATSHDGARSSWTISGMKPNEIQTIKIVGSASSKQDLPCCTSLKYELPALCVTPQVIEPSLAVDVTAPAEMLVCDRIPVNFKVSNTGDGDISDVKIVSGLPTGVVSEQGTGTVTINAGSLAKEQSKEFTVYVKADSTGMKTFEASATAAGDLSASALNVATRVNQPELSVTAANTNASQYVGRDIGYRFTVTNTGDTLAENTVLQAVIPANTRFNSASDNGRASGRAIRWDIGSLAAGASKDVTAKVTAMDAGEAKADVSATAVCASAASNTTSSLVSGIPALLLEVVDVNDPIEVGDEEVYVITVTNQGSADATNIKISAALENMTYISSSGETAGTASGDQVVFGALSQLGPQEKAVWRVNARADKAGDTRFSTKMNSDQLGRDVEETESTFIY